MPLIAGPVAYMVSANRARGGGGRSDRRWTVGLVRRDSRDDTVRRGPARGGPGPVRFSVDLSQDRAPSLADTAELRPCHPEPGHNDGA